MTWSDALLGALGASPFVFFIVFMNLLQNQQKDDDRLALEDERLEREFNEKMRKLYPDWGKR